MEKDIQSTLKMVNREFGGPVATKLALEKLTRLSVEKKLDLQAFLFGNKTILQLNLPLNVTQELLEEAYGPLLSALSRFFQCAVEHTNLNFTKINLLDQSIVINGQSMKIGRALRKCAAALMKREINVPHFLEDIGHKVGLRDLYFLSDLNNIMGNIDILSSRIGSLLSHNNNDHIQITINPLDFLTASICPNFSSCYRPGGSSFAACSGFALNEQTFLVKYFRKNEFIGRFWAHLSKTKDAFITAPIYGCFPHIGVLTFIDYMQEKIGKIYELNVGKANIICPYKPYDVEIDTIACALYAVGPGIDRFELELAKPLCISCGELDAYSTGLCYDCDHNLFICDICRKVFYIDDIFCVDDYTVCENCYVEKFRICEHCQYEIYYENALELVDEDGVFYLCENCAQEHLVDCVICGNSFYSRDGFKTCPLCLRGLEILQERR